MSYPPHDVPWPAPRSASDSKSPSYFPSHLDSNTLTPTQTSQYAPSSSFHVVQGSELPSHPRDSSPTSPMSSSIYPRSRKTTNISIRPGDGGDSSPLPRTQSGTIPLTTNSTVVKSSPASFARPEEVWREILKTAYGRDKAFKIIQYSMRLFLVAHARSSWLLSRPRGGELVRRLNIAVGHLGLSRKTLILFNWLTPLTHILSPAESSVPFSSAATLSSPTLLHRFLHAPPPVLLDLLNAVADDVATFWRLGLIGSRIGQKAARLADWFWFASTLAGLVEVGAERAMVKGMLRELETRIYDAEMDKTADLARIDEHEKELNKLRSQYGWLQVTRVKLLMDLVFVSYDLFKFRRAKDSVKTASGLAAAILSTYKMYDSQRNEIFKANN